MAVDAGASVILYEYRCPNCGFTVESFRTLGNRDNAPICGRLVHAYDCCRMVRVPAAFAVKVAEPYRATIAY